MARNLWSKEELEYLKSNYDKKSVQEIADYLGRSYKAVTVKAANIGASTNNSYTEEEITFVKDNYAIMTTSEIAKHLGRTKGSLEGLIRLHGFTKGNTQWENPWTEEELSFLRSNYKNMTIDDIANALGRTKSSITGKASYLEIKKYKKRSNWSDKELQYLNDNYESGLIIQMQKELNRSFKAIHTKANELGLKRDTSTYIEREVEEILKDLNVNYNREVRIRGFIADFVLDGNKVIEVQGDYWHCNPKVYHAPKDEIQERKVKQDRMKKGCFNELGYTILYIWEYDLNNHLDEVIEQIKQFCRPVAKVAGV